MTRLIAKKYRYADGGIYRDNAYNLLAISPVVGGETSNRLGGALVLKDKAIAWTGTFSGFKVKDIIAYSNGYASGATLNEALAKIKPQLQVECR